MHADRSASKLVKQPRRLPALLKLLADGGRQVQRRQQPSVPSPGSWSPNENVACAS